MAKRVRVILLVMVFLLSVGVLLLLRREDNKAEQVYSTLQEIASPGEETAPSSAGDTTLERGVSGESFSTLLELNPDFVGWISIPLTSVNYPVVQNILEKDYYLHRDFYGDYSSYGTPYIHERYEVDSSTNMIIYGHTMSNGTIFSDLSRYTSHEFYQKSSTIEYTDSNGYREYEIFGVFPINVSDEFDYHNYVNLNEEQFNHFVESVLSRSIYSIGVVPRYGATLITLSTCENTTDDMRFVVVGCTYDSYL